MQWYSQNIKNKSREYRSLGLTYVEINKKLGINIPKSTHAYWWKGIRLNNEQIKRINKLYAENLDRAREKAVQVNKIKRENFLIKLDKENEKVADKIRKEEVAKIALSMLCLGEASKYGTGSAFSLASTDKRIIKIFLVLLDKCFNIDRKKFRCTIQCRADQNFEDLEKYWQEVTSIPASQFYKTRYDARSIGKPTRKLNYHGVLKIDYLDVKVQLELESLAGLIYNRVL